MKKKCLILFFILFSLFTIEQSFSQITLNSLDKVKVDELSDEQVLSFIKKYTEAGYSLANVESIAKSKNMSAAEFEKLRTRIQSLEGKSNNSSPDLTQIDKIEKESTGKKLPNLQLPENVQKNDSRIYGASLFSNSKLLFEPNQNIATPRNYRIGPGDQLHVDVYGFSEATYDLPVSPEGTIRIPNVGLIQLNGLTIENAENLIRKKLSIVYSSINTGRTSVVVSIDKIRSLKVFILGEVMNPGSYTLPSVSSVFNALNACGGPSEKGSMRNIKVIRAGKEIATVDLYEFLMQGIMPSDVTLQDQDVIQVPPYGNRVTVNGAVKRDGIYEMKDNESLSSLIDFCGGFAEDAYLDRISVTRNMNGEKGVADVSKELYSMFIPQAGDVFSIDRILEKYSNRVQILGSVFRPGAYALDEGMSLRDLITKANGLTEDAFMEQASIVRLQDDLTPEIISFNVKDLMEGRFNIALKKEDIITIGGKTEFEPQKMVSIYGQVFSPGTFPYYENMTLRDIIFLSKGFKDEADASKIEVTRQIFDEERLKQDVDKAEIFELSLNEDLSGSDGDFKLQPRDQVTIRTKEGYEFLGQVQILGEVQMPGVYAISSKKEKISDVLARAGGISNYAFVDGAFLIRKTNRTQAELQRDMKLIQALSSISEEDEILNVREELMSRTDMVGIDLHQIIKNPGSETDLNMENGDMVFVPKEMQTITVAGAVQVPGKEVYTRRSLRKYIKGAGGFSSNASKRNIYVAYPNGKIASTKKFLWFKMYPAVTSGSHIFVPEKTAKTSDGKENATFFVTLFGSIVSMASVVVTAISVIK